MDMRVTPDVPHPGSFISEELEARGWSQRDLAFVLDVPEQAISMIVAGKRGITPEMAKALGDAFDVSPEFFLNLQRIYELSHAPAPNAGVAARARLQQSYPIREMIIRGWLANVEATMLEVQVARFFGVPSMDDVPHMRHAAKKTHYDKTPPAQLAWLFRVKQIAETMIVKQYSATALRAAADGFRRSLAAPEEARHVPRVLAECGVKFVVVEALPASKIAGVCFWLGATPVIGMSLQRDYIDSFWFVLRHEIEHALCGHGKTRECIDDDQTIGLDPSVAISREEQTANAAAAQFCVPQDALSSFIDRVQPYFSEQRVLLFAQKLNLHPGIVVGQLQRRLMRYDFLKKHQAKIRQIVTAAAATDGWGSIYPVAL